MKRILTCLAYICIVVSCSRKTVPPKPTHTLENGNNVENNKGIITDSVTKSLPATDSATGTFNTVMVIADGYGKLITPRQNLPADGTIQYDNLQLSRGFTAQQRANLQARYHTVPPRVLYVPAAYSQGSLKGSYYIYKKKFWYWKRSDGLYYLDQKYYQ